MNSLAWLGSAEGVLALGGLGLLAGGLTTTAGLGGGMVLIAALSTLTSPLEALVISAPALLTGNIHRVFLFRRYLDRAVVGPFVLGAVPAALIAGLLSARLPPSLLTVSLLVAVALGWLRATGRWSYSPGRNALVGAGGIAGAVTATSGAAVMTGAVLWSTGIQGTAYLATASLCAASMHAARLAAYGLAGETSFGLLAASGCLALMIAVGNALGRRIRSHLEDQTTRWLELGALTSAALLAAVRLGAA